MYKRQNYFLIQVHDEVAGYRTGPLLSTSPPALPTETPKGDGQEEEDEDLEEIRL